jgi:nucleoside-diphosphate-sugar epimerase
MKILAIGGTGFMGRFLVPQLQEAGHDVTVFHRGNAPRIPGARAILGDHRVLSDHRELLRRESFDAVIDMILSSERQAKALMETFRGAAGRVIALSSMDVYRTWGVFYGFESADPPELPITEDSPLRTKHTPYPPDVLKRLQQVFSWFDDEYEKITVERAVLADDELPGTVMRLPMVYGPGDPLHRFHPVLKRIDDGRTRILFADDVAAMRTPRGYVENIAAGIALATVARQATGRIYNVGEMEAFSELAWSQKIAAAADWTGEFMVLPHDKTPPHLHWPGNTTQHLVVSTDRIRRELGYREPVSLDQAIRRTIAWERSHPPQTVGIALNYEAEDAALSGWQASA